jgi:ubiquinone/menaquinone biosynthesis C-methylase UbiE
LSHHVLARLLQISGPCRVLHANAQNISLLENLLLAGCDAYATGPTRLPHPRWIRYPDPEPRPFDAMLVEISAANQLDPFFRRFGTSAILAVHGHHLDRKAIDRYLLESVWRRHPADLLVPAYQSLHDDVLAELAFYERIPEIALAGRNPYTDMLRESGSQADAHIVRFALAAQFVRTGDTVLDCSSGLGYGTAILASLSTGANFIGIELDPATVEYARANYGREAIAFHPGDAANLKNIPDSSIDMVVSMETVEHIPDWRAALQEFHRVLKPDGRFIVSACAWSKLEPALKEHFLIEMRYTHTAPRILHTIDLNSEVDSEWLIAVACRNPQEAANTADYKHPAFHASFEKSGAAVVDFAHGYDNPYLYRTMVQMGERIHNDLQLATLAHSVIVNARPDSADRGAAICVFGYQVLEHRELQIAPTVLRFICDYLTVTTPDHENRHITRWRVSLTFLAGRICEWTGDRHSAAVWYRAVTRSEAFSPLLATKTVAASFFEARIHLAEADEEAAKCCFARGLDQALSAIKGNLNEVVGNPEQPIPFGLSELAEVIDMGSQCANALVYLPLWNRSPGLFWKQVDIKRFGLATWAKQLEQENQTLRLECALK